MSSLQVKMLSLKWTSSNVNRQHFDDSPIRMNETQDFSFHLLAFIIICGFSPRYFSIDAVIPGTHKTFAIESQHQRTLLCLNALEIYCQFNCISFCSRCVKSKTFCYCLCSVLT